ncbi:hypothetical protein HHX47_DHR6000541 [Lentinula edodes]|nr:hypothetical protein HHX47_DHR6000541 [Lentinula edodes]
MLPGNHNGIQSRDSREVIGGGRGRDRDGVIEGEKFPMERGLQKFRMSIYVSGVLGGSKESIMRGEAGVSQHLLVQTLNPVCRIGIVVRETTCRTKVQFAIGKASLRQVTQNEVDNEGKAFESMVETMIQ